MIYESILYSKLIFINMELSYEGWKTSGTHFPRRLL